MPKVNEIMESRIGVSVGTGATGNITRTFSVQIDTVGDSPLAVIAQGIGTPTDDSGVSLWVPEGSPHPWVPAARANMYTITKQVTKQIWEVTVNYSTDFARGESTEWTANVQAVSVTENIKEELPDLVDRKPSRIIGPPLYKIPDDSLGPVQAKYVATSAATGDEIGLVRVGGDDLFDVKMPRNAVGFDLEVPAVNITWSRRQPNFLDNTSDPRNTSGSMLGNVLKIYKKLNLRTFLGAVPGSVRFSEFSATSVSAVIGDGKTQNTPGLAWDVSVTFTFFDKPVSPLSLVHTWPDGEGGESVVLEPASPDIDKRVIEDFRVAHFGAIDFIFLLLGR